MGKYKRAVALSYDSEKDKAPKVVAVGKGYTAERIIKLAKDNKIPLFEDEETVKMLSQVPIGVEIPPELYKVVAEIYAFILNVGYEASSKHKLKDNE